MTPREPEPAGRRVRILYALGGFGAEALNQSRAAWLIYFYAPPDDAGREQLIGLTTVSALLFAGRLLEALDDVLVGYWSDRTRSRLGRRVPFVLAGAPFWALFAVLTFIPPGGGELTVAVYFFLTLQLFHFSATLTSVPYEALLPDIAGTSRDRVAISGLRVAVGIGGAAVGLIGSGVLIHFLGFGGMAASMGILALLTRYAGVVGVWRRSARVEPEPGPSLAVALRAAMTNRHYLILMPSWMLFQTALAMMIGALPYYTRAILNRNEEGLWTSLLTAVAIVSMALTLPVFIRLSERLSPGRAYGRAMLVAAFTFPLMAAPGLVPGVPIVPLALAAIALAGAPVAATYLFPGPLIADIADADRERSGARREGTFYGGQTAVDKTVGSLAPLLLGLLLLLGNTASDPLGVRLVGPAAGVLILAAYFIFRRFDLPARGTPHRG